MKKTFKLGIIFFAISALSYAQINTFSPYTRYGYGEHALYGNGKKRALGGIGIGYRSRNNIDPENPASYTSQDTLSFIFDIGIKGSQVIYETSTLNDERTNFYFDHLTLGFPITSWMKTSLGIRPYSYVGYDIVESLETDVTDRIEYFYKGSGGLNIFHLGNSVELLDKISVGVNFNYLFGSIEQNNIIFTYAADAYNTLMETDYRSKGISLDLGCQYYDKLSDNLKFTVGMVLSPGANLKTEQDSIITNTFSTLVDTLKHVENINQDYKLPQKIGLGLSLEYKDKLTIGFDYSKQDWSGHSFRNINDYLTKNNSFNLGVEFIPNKYSVKRYSDHIEYRLGAYYTNLPLEINNNQLIDKGISFGIGLPFKNTGTKFNIAFEYGSKGTTENNLIKENYFITTFNITLYDFWFYKRKFD